MSTPLERILSWIERLFASDCKRGRHVFLSRWTSFQCVNGVKRHKIHRQCQLCLVSVYEWDDGGTDDGPPQPKESGDGPEV